MTDESQLIAAVRRGDLRALARAITIVEAGGEAAESLMESVPDLVQPGDVIGLTGVPGAGKSSLLDGIIDVYKQQKARIGVVAVDPSSSVHGGAILGDRIRWMRHATTPNVVIRSMASRGSLGGLNAVTTRVVRLMVAAGCRPVFVETVGVGQIGSDITDVAEVVLAVTAPGSGDDIQMMKAGILDVADAVVLNKSDLPGAAALLSSLTLELEHRGGKKIVQTSCIDGSGIARLCEHIDELRTARRTAPLAPSERARRVLEAEIVERSLALLRPILERHVAKASLQEAPVETLARRLADQCASNWTEAGHSRAS